MYNDDLHNPAGTDHNTFPELDIPVLDWHYKSNKDFRQLSSWTRQMMSSWTGQLRGVQLDGTDDVQLGETTAECPVGGDKQCPAVRDI